MSPQGVRLVVHSCGCPQGAALKHAEAGGHHVPRHCGKPCAIKLGSGLWSYRQRTASRVMAADCPSPWRTRFAHNPCRVHSLRMAWHDGSKLHDEVSPNKLPSPRASTTGT